MKSLNKFLKLITKLEYLIRPSLAEEEESLHKFLLWGSRAYYIYSGLLFVFIKSMDYFNITFNYWFYAIIFMIQAAILFYIIQTYRRFFSISFKLKRNFILHFIFFLWLMIFLLTSVDQIIGIPIFSGSILSFVVGGKVLSPYFLFTKGIYLVFFFILLGISGEYLLRKIGYKEVAS